MKQVVFLYDDFLNENKQELTKLPLEFICFAYIKNATLYKKNNKYYAINSNDLNKKTKYKKVYGAIYILHSSEQYIRQLDALMTCSRSLLGANHDLDIMHRHNLKAIPIHFKTVEDFLKLRYNEMEEVSVIVYFANHKNDFIKKNVISTVKNREVLGFDINNFINLVYKEICENEDKNELKNV